MRQTPSPIIFFSYPVQTLKISESVGSFLPAVTLAAQKPWAHSFGQTAQHNKAYKVPDSGVGFSFVALLLPHWIFKVVALNNV